MRVKVLAGAAAVSMAAALLGAAAAPSTASAGHDSGRQSRTSGVAAAGANVYLWSTHRSDSDGGGCTLSFVVRSRPAGKLGALTAGHCVGTLPGGPTYAVHQTRNLRANTTDPGLLLGTVAADQFRFG